MNVEDVSTIIKIFPESNYCCPPPEVIHTAIASDKGNCNSINLEKETEAINLNDVWQQVDP
ncbi:MAG: hypothetical protein ACI9JK_001736 [Phycisphaerales bacterium]